MTSALRLRELEQHEHDNAELRKRLHVAEAACETLRTERDEWEARSAENYERAFKEHAEYKKLHTALTTLLVDYQRLGHKGRIGEQAMAALASLPPLAAPQE